MAALWMRPWTCLAGNQASPAPENPALSFRPACWATFRGILISRAAVILQSFWLNFGEFRLYRDNSANFADFRYFPSGGDVWKVHLLYIGSEVVRLAQAPRQRSIVASSEISAATVEMELSVASSTVAAYISDRDWFPVFGLWIPLRRQNTYSES
jgi:hypothetical protein